MSKLIKQSVPSHGYGLVMGSYIPDSLVGRIMEIVEAIGLPEKQETSVKNLIKDVIYAKTTETMGEAACIASDLHDLTREKVKVVTPRIVNLSDVK